MIIPVWCRKRAFVLSSNAKKRPIMLTCTRRRRDLLLRTIDCVKNGFSVAQCAPPHRQFFAIKSTAENKRNGFLSFSAYSIDTRNETKRKGKKKRNFMLLSSDFNFSAIYGANGADCAAWAVRFITFLTVSLSTCWS